MPHVWMYNLPDGSLVSKMSLSCVHSLTIGVKSYLFYAVDSPMRDETDYYRKETKIKTH